MILYFRFEVVRLYCKRQECRYPTAAAIERLSAELGLPRVGQDWEIESAAPHRVEDFLDYYETRELNDDERFTLMSLIIASFDERLYTDRDDVSQGRIVACLIDRFGVLNYLVQYWAFPDETDEELADNAFNFTPIARLIMQAKYGSRDLWPRTPIAIKRADKLVPEQGVCDVVSIADNRDGTFELWWSKTAGRDSGRCDFPSIDEAMDFARCQLGIEVDAWCEIK